MPLLHPFKAASSTLEKCKTANLTGHQVVSGHHTGYTEALLCHTWKTTALVNG